MESDKNYILFCHKPYGFPMRAIFVQMDLIPEKHKNEFDKMYNFEEGININDDEMLQICTFWKLLADDSPSNDDYLFGDDNIPEWFQHSITYYQNEQANRNDMLIKSPRELFDKLKNIKVFKSQNINVVKSLILCEYIDDQMNDPSCRHICSAFHK